ncbi:MAG: hypothetical protein RLY70_1180 [Planctomycetota bacterium]
MWKTMNAHRLLLLAFLLGAALFRGGMVASGDDQIVPEMAALADRLVANLRGKEYKRIAVAARFTLALERSEQFRLAAFVEPADQALAEAVRMSLRGLLRQRPREGWNPSVLSGVSDIDATNRLQVGDAETIKRVAKQIEADAIVFGRLRKRDGADEGEERGWPSDLIVECQVVDGNSGLVVADVVEEFLPSVSNAAFFGDSFEVRRWDRGELFNVGFHDMASGVKWFEPVDHRPGGKYADICRARSHPLSNQSFPFKMSVRVNEIDQRIYFVDRYAYVALRPGDEYSVHMENHCGSGVLVALFVDGVNVREKALELPSNCKCFHLDGGSVANFRGYYSEYKTEKDKWSLEPFLVGTPDNSPAVRQGRLSSLSQITAVFFTVGHPQPTFRTDTVVAQVPVPRPSRGSVLVGGQWIVDKPGGDVMDRLVTIAGPPRIVSRGIDVRGTAGLVLATVTLRYGTREKIEQLAAAAGNGDLDTHATDNGYVNCDFATRSHWPKRTAVDRAGFSVRNYSVRGQEGVIADRVVPGSPAAYLYRGGGQRFQLVADRDVITHVDGIEATNTEVFERLIMNAKRNCILTVFDRAQRQSANYAIFLW